MDETRKAKYPVYTDKIGRVHLSVWENRTHGGGTFETFVVERRYAAGEDADGKTLFKSSSSFTMNELGDVEEAVALVRSYLKNC